MKEIDELREKLEGYVWTDAEQKTMRSMLDAIGRAVAERYIELPTDADGRPLHWGDRTDKGEVYSLHFYGSGTYVCTLEKAGESFDPWQLRRVEPDSWERIIEDAEKLGSSWYDNDHINMGTDEHADGLRQLVERCKALAGEGR